MPSLLAQCNNGPQFKVASKTRFKISSVYTLNRFLYLCKMKIKCYISEILKELSW